MKYLIFSAFRYMPSIPAGNTPDKPREKSRRGDGSKHNLKPNPNPNANPKPKPNTKPNLKKKQRKET